jgi:adenine-specific DNA-methyltransferase
MKSNKKIFDGLAPFYGGKRRLVRHIMPHIKGDVVADVFMGGGSVSLACKSVGKKVIANDIAYRSKIVGEALIRNNTEYISREDVYSLFLPSNNIKFVEEHFVPKFFVKEAGIFLDNAFSNASKRTSPKRELLKFMLYKFVMMTRQFGGFGHNGDSKMIAEGREMELLEISSEARAKKVEYMISHPLPMLLKIKDQINGAIINNGQANEVYQMDCFEFLKKMEVEGKKIDTAYFDSPYAGSLIYSSHYKVLDQLLSGKLDLDSKDDAFNKSSALQNFEHLFSASQFIPHWVISMGYNPASQSGIKGEELLSIVQKFRPAKIYYLDHVWAINNITNRQGKFKEKGKSQKDNVEYLIVTE